MYQVQQGRPQVAPINHTFGCALLLQAAVKGVVGPWVELLLLFCEVQNGLALVAAAIGAGVVREAHAAALLALDQMHWLERVMGAAAIAAALG